MELASSLGLFTSGHLSCLLSAWQRARVNREDLPPPGLRSIWTIPRPCASWKVCPSWANFRGHYNTHQQ